MLRGITLTQRWRREEGLFVTHTDAVQTHTNRRARCCLYRCMEAAACNKTEALPTGLWKNSEPFAPSEIFLRGISPDSAGLVQSGLPP